jgi:hypothetical protein
VIVIKQFRQSRDHMITSDLVLVNNDPDLPVMLAYDACYFELGAVLSHRLPNGTERPIAFASRSLSSADRNYCKIIIIRGARIFVVFVGRSIHEFKKRCDVKPK